MTVAQLLKHDFSKGSLKLYDSNGNLIYQELSTEYWVKSDYDTNGNRIYSNTSTGHWEKQEFDSYGNRIYYENSRGVIINSRPKSSCNGKVVEIDGKQYKLTEI